MKPKITRSYDATSGAARRLGSDSVKKHGTDGRTQHLIEMLIASRIPENHDPLIRVEGQKYYRYTDPVTEIEADRKKS